MVGIAGLLVVFHFASAFAYFPDILLDSLRFLVKWISDSIA
ncbi:MAG: hypothetical protein ACFFGZ_01015 [Candidatus Thorarchaeota archaeon]